MGVYDILQDKKGYLWVATDEEELQNLMVQTLRYSTQTMV